MSGFKPSSWQQDPRDLAKEYDAWERAETAPPEVQTKPEEVSLRMVRKGVIDPNTGLLTGNPKQSHISRFTPSQRFQDNYERTFKHA